MTIHKVDRKVDTVIVEMDISTAEKIMEVMALVVDSTGGYLLSDMAQLRLGLMEKAHVRYPSPLYRAETPAGFVILRNITSEEREEMREGRI